MLQNLKPNGQFVIPGIFDDALDDGRADALALKLWCDLDVCQFDMINPAMHVEEANDLFAENDRLAIVAVKMILKVSPLPVFVPSPGGLYILAESAAMHLKQLFQVFGPRRS